MELLTSGDDVACLLASEGRAQSIINEIRPLVEAGFAIHWLYPKKKSPIGEAWQERQVATVAELQASYSAGNNVGVRLGEPSRVEGGFLHVIDMDIRKPEEADAAWETLSDLLPDVDLHALPTVQSGSGGESRHIYFVTDTPFRSRKLAVSGIKFSDSTGRHWTWELELFGTDKQVVLPPSIHPDSGQPYRWITPFDLLELELGAGPIIPSVALAAAGADEDTDKPYTESERVEDYSVADVRRRLSQLLEHRWTDYHSWRDIGMALHHQFRAGVEGLAIWEEYSAQKPGWQKGVTRKMWRSLGRQRRGRPITFRRIISWANEDSGGYRTTSADEFEPLDDDQPTIDNSQIDDDFSALETSDSPAQAPAPDGDWDGGTIDEPAPDDWVTQLNGKHGVAMVEGKCVVLHHKPSGGTSYGSVTDLNNFYEYKRCKTKTGTEAITKAWMRHSKRATYPNGIVFAPAGGPEGAYNHWRGYSVQADAAASCSLFLTHLRDTICGRDDDAYQWLIRWFAHMIQRPGEKPGTAVVLKGRKGTGKDTVGDYVGGLFAPHHTKIGNAEHLYGRFNAHQEKTLMLHVEEGFWAGDKKAEGALKHVITSEQVQIEPKGVNAFQVQSVLRVFISSNESWIVPASFDERRFFVLDIPGRKRDAAYFTALRDEMVSGGRAALLHHLQTLDLSGFDVRNPPMTGGLRDQKLASLKGVEAWWHETLQRGLLSSFDGEDEWLSSAKTIGRDQLRGSYVEWAKARRFDGELANDATFGRRLREMLPELHDSRPRVAGSRVRKYEVPALADCRAAFDQWIGMVVEWEEGGG